jgi:ABC-2 type transport system permease protein
MKTLREIYDYRQMIFSLVRRDLRGRYKRSVLGFLWTFINPLLQIAIYTMVFSVILKSTVDKYYLFLFVALIPWIFFSSSMTTGAASVISQASMVTKIYFPREVLPIAYVTSSFVNMLYCFIVVFMVVFFAGIKISIFALLCLPLIMAAEYVMALAIGMTVSALTVYFRDLEHILGLVALAWQFLTPVMYGVDIVPDEVRPIFMLNPMTPIIVAYRDVLFFGRVPELTALVKGLGFGIALLVFAFFIFGKLKRNFAEEM